jgi:hypothetical protein
LMPLVWHRSGGNGAVGGQCLNRPPAAAEFVYLTRSLDDLQFGLQSD